MKKYTYIKNTDESVDREFSTAESYGQIKCGETVMFWKRGLKWYVISLSEVTRIYRRVEYVYGKICCGGDTYDMQRLVLVLKNGEELEIPVGDRMEKKAVELMEKLQKEHPEIQYGKE